MNPDYIHRYKNVYFLGIGGISMSGLAEILKTKGFNVSGSDMKESDTTKRLKAQGIKVNIGHRAENITPDISILVYTAAVKQDNPEFIAAKALDIKIIDRAQLLSEIMKEYPYSVAVSGTHGKTTTTSMLTEILVKANLDPTISVGGILPSIGGSVRVGSSEYFVAEACEYFDSFLKFNPYIAIILNIESDHLDYFFNFEQIQNSFKQFARRVPPEGFLIINRDISSFDFIIKKLPSKVLTFGMNKETALFWPDNILEGKSGFSFNLMRNKELLGKVSLQVPGKHNIIDALAAATAASALGINPEAYVSALSEYSGVNRRFQFKGEACGAHIYDDYAHHPTEIKATLAAAATLDYNRIWCVFQPHTFSRTRAFLNDFSEAFDLADNIIITDIYAAREKDTGEIHARDLVDKLEARGKNAFYISGFHDAANFLRKSLSPGDLLITMGAGDVHVIGEELLDSKLSTLST